MPSLPFRGALWLSFAAVVLAVFLGLQHPLQDIFTSDSRRQTFCYSKGVTAKFSIKTATTCFTVKDGLFVDVFVPTSELPVEATQGHAIPGLWDGVSTRRYHRTCVS
jgi:hypothetical protein